MSSWICDRVRVRGGWYWPLGMLVFVTSCAAPSRENAAAKGAPNAPQPATGIAPRVGQPKPKVPKNGGQRRGQRDQVRPAKVALPPPTPVHPLPAPASSPDRASPVSTPTDGEDALELSTRPAPYPLPAVNPLEPPGHKEMNRARRLVERGMRLYRKGEYDRAESFLKEAISIYPFVAEANLSLGKIFLIRGSALRDPALINSARLMFEMARALDPEMREAAVLLELFQAIPPE